MLRTDSAGREMLFPEGLGTGRPTGELIVLPIERVEVLAVGCEMRLFPIAEGGRGT